MKRDEEWGELVLVDSRQDPFSLGLVTPISQGGDEVRSESSLDVGCKNPMCTYIYEDGSASPAG
jgi:hypothetical protein